MPRLPPARSVAYSNRPAVLFLAGSEFQAGNRVLFGGEERLENAVQVGVADALPVSATATRTRSSGSSAASVMRPKAGVVPNP